jgi:hypothetical protein
VNWLRSCAPRIFGAAIEWDAQDIDVDRLLQSFTCHRAG